MAEVPDEVTLAINISNCPCHCEGCHSSQLAEDIGEKLNEKVLDELIQENRSAITCVAFMGGDAHPAIVDKLAKYVIKNYDLKTAWYSGRQELSDQIHLKNFHFIKLGPYMKDKGPLNSKTTNQRMYQIQEKSADNLIMVDITNKFWK